MCFSVFFENTRSLLGCTNQNKINLLIETLKQRLLKDSRLIFMKLFYCPHYYKNHSTFFFRPNTKNTENWVKSLKSWTYCLYEGGMVTNDKNSSRQRFWSHSKGSCVWVITFATKTLSWDKVEGQSWIFFCSF